MVEWAHGNGERMTPEAARAPRVALVVSSTRPVRVGGQLGVRLAQIIEGDHLGIEVVTIDLRELALPFLDEPRMASLGGYVHEHTRRWAATITDLDAMIVLTPQYNWGYPAPLKNAIDYLFAEWRGLPGLLVTYGTHGGTKCYDQITQVLDRVGRLQLPPEYLTTLGLQDRVRLELESRHIEVHPAGDDDADTSDSEETR